MREKKKIPQNSRLWNMIVSQAKQKYQKYPSPAASSWVHREYEKHGGRFVLSNKDTEEGKKRESSRKHKDASDARSKASARSKSKSSARSKSKR